MFDSHASPDSGPTRIMCACAARIRVMAEKYRGPLELRRRQIAAASAAPQSRRAEAILADTVAGYASELRDYATELRPEVVAFVSQCEEFGSACSLPPEDGQPRSAEAFNTYVGWLKLARAEQQVVARAADAFAFPHAQPPGVEVQLRAVLSLFGEYGTALATVESVCLSVLVASNIDPPTR
jgi:hypothetical protein